MIGKKKHKKNLINTDEVVLCYKNKERQRLTLPPMKAVPSAQLGLTSLFGMERGDPQRYSHHKVFSFV